jgi:hypothetical protein
MKHLFIAFSILLFTSFYNPNGEEKPTVGPPQYPQGYFASPVAGTMELAGSFGELRANHFHAGIDIAPTSSGNEPIFATADGYVSRIRTQENGYGQALFINHPNGYTTVHAHLHAFSNEIKAYLRQKQYETENFEQDLVLQPTDIPVKQGQQIALMGNRGASRGQHLHFEIRETKTDKAVNPLLFGFHVPDNVPPKFEDLKVYLMDDKKEVIGKRYFNPKRQVPGLYKIEVDTVDVAAPNVAFAIQAIDLQSGNSGENGIYTLELKSNDVTVYKFRAEKCGFDETRYLNAHVDYLEHYTRQYFFHRAFRLPGDQLKMYESLQNDGIIPLSMTDSACKKITLLATDVMGNTTTLSFVVRPKAQTNFPTAKPYTYLFPFDKESVIKPDSSAFFYFPKGCFYENLNIRFGQSYTEGGQFSQTYQLHEVQTPIQYDFRIGIKPLNLPDSLRSKAFIAYCTRTNGQTTTCGGTWDKDGFLTTKNSKFGNYAIEVDQTPPTIKPEDFAMKMTKSDMLSFKISDNIEGRPVRYRAEMDGQWFLMELDGKYDLLYCYLKDLPSPLNTEGEHSLKLTVTDDRGNVKVFERKFDIVDHIEKPKPAPKSTAKSKSKSEHKSTASSKKKK